MAYLRMLLKVDLKAPADAKSGPLKREGKGVLSSTL